MQFSLDTASDCYTIRAYTPQQIIVAPPKDIMDSMPLVADPRFGERPLPLEILESTFVIMPRLIIKNWPPHDYTALTAETLAELTQYQPEIVLLGSGPRLRWPAKGVREPLMAQGIGVEVMDSSAACRTYNILTAELRQVAALIYVENR